MSSVEVAEPSIDFLSPNVAVETGSAVVVQPEQEAVSSEYVAIHMRTPDGWKMDSVRETEAAESTSPNDKLQELDWMVGSWIDESEGTSIQTTCRWTKNHSFLTRSFKVYVEGRVDAAGTQVVGWDPVNETIRSWSFTSDGGFGVGAWSREGDRWSFAVRQCSRMDGGDRLRRSSTSWMTTLLSSARWAEKSTGS